MRFRDDKHQAFYEQQNPRDVYERALIYLVGLCSETRRNFPAIYDIKGRMIDADAIYAGWQTGTSRRVTRLAFNLSTDDVPTARRFDAEGYDLPIDSSDFEECRQYSASDIFCCEYAPYFIEAIRLRYPEYMRRED